MRLHCIRRSEKEPLSINLYARFKETQTFLTKPFFRPTNVRLMTERPLNSTLLKFYIEGEHGARLEHGMFPDAHPPPQSNAAFDHAECTDDAIVRHVNGSVYTCRRMDHWRFPFVCIVFSTMKWKTKGEFIGNGREEMKIKTKNNDARFEGVHRIIRIDTFSGLLTHNLFSFVHQRAQFPHMLFKIFKIFDFSIFLKKSTIVYFLLPVAIFSVF